MASVSNNKMKKDTGDSYEYGNSPSCTSKPGTTTIEDREAAEVLVQMYLGMGNVRKSIITENSQNRSSDLTIKPSVPNSVIVSSVSSSAKPPTSMNFNSRNRSEPSAFAQVHLGGYSMSQSVNTVPNSGLSISIHPTQAPQTPQRVPISVVQRKEIVGRNRRTLSPPINPINHHPAITIRPINMDENNREMSKPKGPIGPQITASEIYSAGPDISKLSSVARCERSFFNAEPKTSGQKAKISTEKLSSIAKCERSFFKAEPVISSQMVRNSTGELSGMAKCERSVFEAEPMTSSQMVRNSTVIEKGSSSTNSSSSNSNYYGINIKDSGKIPVESLLLQTQRTQTIEAVSNQNQQRFSSSIPINIGGSSDYQNTSTPNWIISNITNAPRIRIVSPSQLNSTGSLGGVSTAGNILLPGTTLIQITSNNNNYNKKDLSSNNCIENSEQQKIRQNKLMKKNLRAKTPMSRDASEPIAVDEFTIPKEYWAKAFVQSDICHAAGILFKALFTPEEIQNCTLRGRNGTFLLDLRKRSAIFRAVGWMKNKNQNPYSFDSRNLSDSSDLTQDEKMIIEKKVFVERRYQTSRKIRDVPSKRRSNKTNQNHRFDLPQNNSLTILSSEESNPSQEIVVKSEPADFMNGQDTLLQNIVKTFIKDEPMDIHENENSTATAIGASDLEQPPSPKQIKLMMY